MNNKEHILEQAAKTLESLDHIQRAEANPYLLTLIKARLQKEEKSFWTLAFGLLSRPVFAIAAVLLIILLNLTIILNQPTKTAPTQEEEQYFASEYNLSGNTIYDVTVDQQ
jgi:hypothetical protein